MDRNTLIGLGLIGVILAIFTYINQPDPEEYKKQQELAKKELEERQRKEKEKEEKMDEELSLSIPENWMPKTDEEGIIQKDSLNRVIYIDTVKNIDTVLVEKVAGNSDAEVIADENTGEVEKEDAVVNDFEGEIIHLQNDKIHVEINTKGGGVSSVFLLEHQTYEDFNNSKEGDKINPLKLFEADYSTNQLLFPMGGKKIETRTLPFDIVIANKERIALKHSFGNNKYIEYIYTLLPNSYKVNYEIKMNGFGNDVLAENVQLNWETELLKTEKLLSEQRKTSTVFFKGVGESYDYLSELSDDEFAVEHDIDWVAFKQSYFSAIMMPNEPFKKEGTSFKVSNITENDERFNSVIRDYNADITLNIDNTDNGSAKIDWYFGPNDYHLLKQFDNGTEDIINLGWGIFRWVNIYAIQPIFNWLASSGMNVGLAIFLLTLIVKLVLTPIQWKMYSSSAKMRILKPEIDEINEKFPNKEDSMKKQMEMMTLYRESGASPLAGCVPMLIQMPILFAVFRFFPSTFELRQKPFLWAEDLSSYDAIVSWTTDIPVITFIYGNHISLFTLLMAGTTLIYTVLNSGNMQQPSQPGMPNMKVIMYFFPIMMIFFFNNFASGLSYYYFISTLISILTMVMIKNFFVNEEKLKAKMAAKKEVSRAKGSKKGKKSKFQERLEEMQRQQQEKMKNKKK
jgi:YidC/Oxa1 family membrane protein insertase